MAKVSIENEEIFSVSTLLILVDGDIRMNVDGYKGISIPKKNRWTVWNMIIMSAKKVNSEMTLDRHEWKKRIYCADPK